MFQLLYCLFRLGVDVPPLRVGGGWYCARIRWWCRCWWPIATSSCAVAILAVPRRVCGGACGDGRVVVCGGEFVGERRGCELRIFQRSLNECVAAIAAADKCLCTRQVCGGDFGGRRVVVYGGDFVGERCGCGLRIFWRRLEKCAAAIAAADKCLCTLAAAIVAAEELK